MIYKLSEKNAEEYIKLRREALLDSPFAFASSLEDDHSSNVEKIREYLRQGPDSVIFGAFIEELVGMAGLHRDRHKKSSHKAHLWGMYVCTEHRRKGLGRQLVQAVINHAQELPGVEYIHLSVSSAAPEAKHLYESIGFSIWGTEPDALRYDDRTISEHHMVFHLRKDSV
jgi:ribosomal protein S18 acetylase RimI-like enzyme